MNFKFRFLFRLGLFCLLTTISTHVFAQLGPEPRDFVENNMRDVAIRLRIKKSKACIPVYASDDLTTQVQCLTQSAVISTLIPRDVEITPGTSDRKSIQKMLEQNSSGMGSLQKVTIESGHGSQGKVLSPGLPGFIDLKAANKAGVIDKYIGEDVGAYPDDNEVRDFSGSVPKEPMRIISPV